MYQLWNVMRYLIIVSTLHIIPYYQH